MLICVCRLSPGYGPLLGWDAGLIFGQNVFLETTTERLRSYSRLTLSCDVVEGLLEYLCLETKEPW